MAPYRGVVEVFQKIRAHFFDTPELDLDPALVKAQFISSIWRRTITYIWGVRNGVSIPVKISADGSLGVQPSGSGVDAYDVKTGTGPDAHGASGQLAPTDGAVRWDFLIETEDAKVKFLEPDAVTYYSEIPLVVGYYSIPIDSPGVSLCNRVSGVTCAFHISAFHS